MGMKPDEFLESFVEGNLEDCRDDPGCLRRAFNAAVSASHLADHYYHYNRLHNPAAVARFPKIGTFIEYLTVKTSGNFRDLRSIANVYKHLYAGGKHKVHSTILSGGALESVRLTGGTADVDQLGSEYEEAPAGEVGRSFVQFTRKDGSKAEFLPVLESFVEYWYRTHAWQDA